LTASSPVVNGVPLESLTTEAPLPEETNRRRLELFSHHFRWLLANLPIAPGREWTVIEFGHGQYGWSDLYAKFFPTVYGVDIEDYSRFHPGVRSIRADLTKEIPLPSQLAELVVSHSVMEHVRDIPAVLSNMDRLVKLGAFVYVTVSPLYYSAAGSHVDHPRPLTNWEHLDWRSPYYLLDNPLPHDTLAGHDLNKMTLGDFLGWVGRLPWSILNMYRMVDPQPIAPHVDRSKWPETDLRTSGFSLLAKKEWHTPGRVHASVDPGSPGR
jgi:SAM-dependent methyltransferase